MKRNVVYLIITFHLFLSGCVFEDQRMLVIENNSSETIYYWYSRNYPLHHYPDLSLPDTKPINIFSVPANNSQFASGTDPNWNSIFDQLPEDKLTIYFFDTSPQSEEEWQNIILSNDTLGTKSVTLDELVSNEYKISFP